jgi:hypothetical protein
VFEFLIVIITDRRIQRAGWQPFQDLGEFGPEAADASPFRIRCD